MSVALSDSVTFGEAESDGDNERSSDGDAVALDCGVRVGDAEILDNVIFTVGVTMNTVVDGVGDSDTETEFDRDGNAVNVNCETVADADNPSLEYDRRDTDGETDDVCDLDLTFDGDRLRLGDGLEADGVSEYDRICDSDFETEPSRVVDFVNDVGIVTE